MQVAGIYVEAATEGSIGQRDEGQTDHAERNRGMRTTETVRLSHRLSSSSNYDIA